ncbi:MAG: hypothetical protein ABSC06_36370 [Rhodopila sp.]
MVDFDAPLISGDNMQQRCACVLVLDHSGSMEGDPIAKLNEALREFPTHLTGDPLLLKRVEIAVVGFPPAQVLQPFCSAAEFVPPVLKADGSTPLGAAVKLGYQLIEERKVMYRASRLDYFRPVMITITDGVPDVGDDWRGAAAMVRDAEEKLKLSSFVFGVPGADQAVLQEFTMRPAARLIDLNFAGLFLWLKSTLKAVSGSQSHTGADPTLKVSIPKPPPKTFDWDAA